MSLLQKGFVIPEQSAVETHVCALTRALSQNVTNAPESALTTHLKKVKVTVQNKLHYCKDSPDKIQE